MPRSKAWIEIAAAGLRHNLTALRHTVAAGTAISAGVAGGTQQPSLLAVIKADAYGHGASLCAPVLAGAGAEWLGVTNAAEGVSVRGALAAAGFLLAEQTRVLVMCGPEPEDAADLVEHQLTPVIWLPEHLAALDRHVPAERPLGVHLEIDTGMARQGARPGVEVAAFLDRLRLSPGLRLDGIFTHFASAEVVGSPLTDQQMQRFTAALDQAANAGFGPAWLHAGNTSTLDEARLLPALTALADRQGARLLVRTGLALFGYALPLEGYALAPQGNALPLQGAAPVLAPLLQPVATWKTRVLALNHLSAGETVGYSATFTAPRPMRLALLPVGYADGLRRELSGTHAVPGGWVMLHGLRAPIVGRISMNLTTVDVTGISGVAPGDEVTLLGPGITADDHAHLARTIPYEILCGLRSAAFLVD